MPASSPLDVSASVYEASIIECGLISKRMDSCPTQPSHRMLDGANGKCGTRLIFDWYGHFLIIVMRLSASQTNCYAFGVVDMENKKLVVFDFDGTLVSKDTGFEFYKWLTTQSTLRTILTIALLPIIGTFYYFTVTRKLGINILCYISTAFQNMSLFILRKNFIDYYFSAAGAVVYADGVEELRQHQKNGAEVIILSGCPHWLLHGVAKHIGLIGCKIIGSEQSSKNYALLLKNHCYRENKIKMAREAGATEVEWAIGYSDSLADIPMLRSCHRKVLINVSSRTMSKFRKNLVEPIECRAWA
jgi:phosphatidylglycerophosphatase C